MKRPSPALVISCVALFASLGGTGYAATQLHSGAVDAKAKSKVKAPQSLTSGQVNKLIAAYLTAHHLGATGPAGAQGSPGTPGAPGGEGKIGPQGPGAQKINDVQIGTTSGSRIATVGLWTLTLTCTNAGTEVLINGPGSIHYTESFGPSGNTASTVSAFGNADGFASDIGNGFQQGMHAFLTSGGTMEQLDLEITAANDGQSETCGVVGDAIPAS